VKKSLCGLLAFIMSMLVLVGFSGCNIEIAAPENLHMEIDYGLYGADYYVCWNNVAEADYYMVKILDKEVRVDETRYLFESAVIGETYTVSVCAVRKKAESEYAFANLACNVVKTGLEYTLTEDEKGYVVTRGSAEFAKRFDSEGVMCLEKELIFPDYYCGLPVVEVANAENNFLSSTIYIFKGAYYTYIRLPLYLERLNAGFLNYTELREIALPETLTEIGVKAFYGCTQLVSLSFPEALTEIGCNAFYGCTQLASLNFPKALERIDGRALEGTAWLASRPDGLIIINNILYGYKGDKSHFYELVVPDGIEKIAPYAFYEYGVLTSVTLNIGLLEVGEVAFFKCSSLTSVFFTNAEGWTFADVYHGDTENISVSSEELSSPQTAANYLTSLAYIGYRWTCNLTA